MTTNVIRAEESVEINRSIEEVFSYTSNPESFPEWAATGHLPMRTSQNSLSPSFGDVGASSAHQSGPKEEG
jgi:uncharacterized protein YndB with AHSA1/START domain